LRGFRYRRFDSAQLTAVALDPFKDRNADPKCHAARRSDADVRCAASLVIPA
jgi:hypothetical protein